MPMGAVMAFKGIESCMVLLHGSQGCSTYIRRHMAGHYNEPVDIASSSLSEQGTVYGGEDNFKKGIRNVLKLYNPDIIGVATTCLAETIGEDVNRYSAELSKEELGDIRIIPVQTPGYGGSQFEGYFAALTAVVKEIAKDRTPNGKINIIASNLSPGDIRNIKDMLGSMGIDYILLPDVSMTLDSPFSRDYKRIPEGGTKLSDIEKMAGAAATVEIGMTVPPKLSPGQYLYEKFGVPLYRSPVPAGIRGTDFFLRLVSTLTNVPITPRLRQERGYLADAMIDSHKYNAEGRAVIFGEPELCYAMYRLCFENGIKPLLISTGTQSETLKRLIDSESGESCQQPLVIDDTDFETIQKYAVKLNANILIGNSDGKVITEKEGIPLVRAGFPIHDRVGGQRLVYTGYNGSVRLLDEITNTLLENKYEKYRNSIYEMYYKEYRNKDEGYSAEPEVQNPGVQDKTANHPCFSAGACSNARMHIPVAPKCNISCNYCNRKYDCVNESRPGVTSEVLTPEEALQKYEKVRSRLENLKVVGIAGPGDALADFDNTRKSLELIKAADPDITFCLSTNGLMLPYYADEIIRLGVSHVTITINAIDPVIGAKVYRNINYMGKHLTGEEGSWVLINNQLEGLKYLSSKGIMVKVNIVMIKGINDTHIEAVVKKVKEYGAFITNIMPLIPAEGSSFENMPLTSNKELNELRRKCELELKQMYHCKQCRADAIGLLEKDVSSEFRDKACGGCSSKDSHAGAGKTYTFAVASGSGMYVDRHFGQADEFHIYRFAGGNISFIEKRQVIRYCSGPDNCEDEENKVSRIIKAVNGCDAVLALRIGYNPSKILEAKGIKSVQTCDSIDESIRYAVNELEKSNALDAVV